MKDIFQSILQFETPFNWLSLVILVLGVAGIVTGIAKQVRKFAVHAVDVRFKRDLVERGLSVEEIERVLAAASPNRDCERS